ncbi:MAG: hypothetical protein ACXW05_10500 [Gemmatirosa sp.]
MRATAGARIALVVVAAAFAWLTRYVYADVLATAVVFDYMGVRAAQVSMLEWLPFLLLAVLPALWLPVHLRRPTDIVQLFLFYAVHVQTATLMPFISTSPRGAQLLFCAAVTLALLALDARRLLPALRPPAVRPSRQLFWLGIAAFYVLAFVTFARSGYLTRESLSAANVYDQRAELQDRAAEIGRVFFYAANWTGAVFAPFLIVVGLHTKRRWLAVAAAVLAFASFVASSNRANYMAIAAATGGYYLLRVTRGRHLGTAMGASFIALTGLLLAVDVRLGVSVAGFSVPAVTWQVFHRTFSNNGFLSAIYLDTFRSREAAYYADSFLRWVPGPRLEAAVAQIAGASFTDVLGNHANANLWADAYANLGYLGIAIAAAFTALVFWVYDGVSSRLDRLLAAAALVVPASVLSNTATQTALTSNGLLLLFVLVLAWPAPRDGALAAG